MTKVLILNGPNLGMLGTRQPVIYGSESYDDLVTLCTAVGDELGLTVDVRQTDDEATMLGWLHEATAGDVDAVVLNAAAWGHYSIALRDAVAMVSVPLVDVHLSNPAAREDFRHSSVVAGIAKATIAGFGQESYRLALVGLAGLLAKHA
jgi:3-dehydroquinate dehydratase-2